MLTKELQITLNVAVDEATKRRHEFLTLEHMLYALLREQTGSDVIRHCGGNLAALERELNGFLRSMSNNCPATKNIGPSPLRPLNGCYSGLSCKPSRQAAIKLMAATCWPPYTRNGVRMRCISWNSRALAVSMC